MALDWQPYGGAYLAKPKHGYYLVCQRHDPESALIRWVAQFEPSEVFDQRTVEALDLQRFGSFQQAQECCEKHAQGYFSRNLKVEGGMISHPFSF